MEIKELSQIISSLITPELSFKKGSSNFEVTKVENLQIKVFYGEYREGNLNFEGKAILTTDDVQTQLYRISGYANLEGEDVEIRSCISVYSINSLGL